MRFLQYIKELYLKGGYFDRLDPSKYVEIFVNPSKRELKDIAVTSDWDYRYKNLKFVRFFADFSKKIFAWNPNTMHGYVAKTLKIDYFSYDVIAGVAKKTGGNWEMYDTDQAIQPEHAKKDWSWADKYINVTKYIKKEWPTI